MKLDVIMKAILAGEDEEAVKELFQEMDGERIKVMIQLDCNDPDFLSLTKDQIRLLRWLSVHSYLDCEWSIFDEIEVEEV